MSQQLQVLDSQSHEYFHTLHENGLNEILKTHDALVTVAQELHDHLMAGNTESFDCLMQYVIQPSATPPSHRGLSSVDLSQLRDWMIKFDETVLNLVNVLSEARRQREKIGVKRPYKEVPTAVALSELHRLMKTGQFERL